MKNKGEQWRGSVFFQAEDGIRDIGVTGVQTCALPIWAGSPVELELWLGGEGFVSLSTGFSGGLNPFHRSFPVTQKAAGGERVGVEAEVVPKIGRAACRERGEISVVAGSLKKKNDTGTC